MKAQVSFQVAGAAEALVTNLNDEKQKKKPCQNPVETHQLTVIYAH